jgi:hypothetical protein
VVIDPFIGFLGRSKPFATGTIAFQILMLKLPVKILNLFPDLKSRRVHPRESDGGVSGVIELIGRKEERKSNTRHGPRMNAGKSESIDMAI